MNTLSSRLLELVEVGERLSAFSDYESWQRRCGALLHASVTADAARSFHNYATRTRDAWFEGRDKQLGLLEGLAHKLQLEPTDQPDLRPGAVLRPSRRVFVVHGHDVAMREMVARFCAAINLEPVVLHEQANEGRTIIEKFEAHSDVAFAIVLLSSDDVGSVAKASERLRPRARQNVVLELGYFIGKLGRNRVAALFNPEIEIPSDLHGVLFTEFDQLGGWRTKVAQELVSAGVEINLTGLLGA